MGIGKRIKHLISKINNKNINQEGNESKKADLFPCIDVIKKSSSHFIFVDKNYEYKNGNYIVSSALGKECAKLLFAGKMIGIPQSINNSYLKEYMADVENMLGSVSTNQMKPEKYISAIINGIHFIFIACRDETQIKEDIKKARNAGTDFVVAYCQWKENDEKFIMKEQERIAKAIANAGADYIIGTKSGMIQSYNVIETDDKRKVPVLYSSNDFSGADAKKSIIVELAVQRSKDGKAEIMSEVYHPCIESIEKVKGKRQIMSINEQLKLCNLDEKIKLEEYIFKINQSVGSLERFQMKIDKQNNPLAILRQKQDNKRYKDYEIGKIPIVKQSQNSMAEDETGYYYDEIEGVYKRLEEQGVREAKIICAGQIVYDSTLEKNASCFGKYEFSKGFKKVANCFKEADLVVGNLASMAAENYPSVARFQSQGEVRSYYCNARIEFIDTLKAAGFSCLAMANPYNMCTGIDGLAETEELLEKKNIIVSGIGKQKNPIIEINGIKIALLSYTVNCFNKNRIISSEGAKNLLNEYEVSEFGIHVRQVKDAGAELVIVYVNCGNSKINYDLKMRQAIAEEIAEIGGDYVICAIPAVLSKYYKYQTQDGRIVPIATSLGSLVSGVNNEKGEHISALIKIIVRKSFDGNMEIVDNYIPLKIFKEYNGAHSMIVPLHPQFNDEYSREEYAFSEDEITKKLGEEISQNQERTVNLGDSYKENFTIEEIYQILKKRPSGKDLSILGYKYKKSVSCIASRSTALKKGCVAILDNDTSYPIDIGQAVEKGAALVISKKKYKELPCIVPDESVYSVYKKLVSLIRDKYNPITVAITGSVGKTTTKELMSKVFDTYYKTVYVDGNHNTFKAIGEVIQKLQETDEAYIQEVSGGFEDLPRRCSKLLKPDICVITNIGPAHLEYLGTVENVLKNKAQIIAGMKKGGTLVINDDNEYLHGLKRKVKTIRYSNHNPQCHYYARNIVMEENQMTFQIVSKGGKYDEPGVYDAKIYIQGEHNVTNAVGVFATARQAGIPPHNIIAGLASFRPRGERQNMIEAGGCKILIDAYNSNPVSLLSSVKTISNMPVGDKNKKILVLGDMYEQGEESEAIHYNTGKEISKCDFDILLCSGEESRYFVKAAREAGKIAYFISDKACFNQVISELIVPGDVVLFKASGGVRMKATTIQPILGDIE